MTLRLCDGGLHLHSLSSTTTPFCRLSRSVRIPYFVPEELASTSPFSPHPIALKQTFRQYAHSYALCFPCAGHPCMSSLSGVFMFFLSDEGHRLVCTTLLAFLMKTTGAQHHFRSSKTKLSDRPPLPLPPTKLQFLKTTAHLWTSPLLKAGKRMPLSSSSVCALKYRENNLLIPLPARNGDLNGVVSSMKQLEDRFNKQSHYPYVFLNEVPFEDNFRK